ncbi:disease resistance protein RPM1-like isoform X2 [Citrus sinensis]|uniref:disease resistance protein RPM1-like isoform X2 n=1 Tax=Citrus sinensis TaxID=2711 RepID=UPI0022776CCF|nr:disease resistance protein RPM1-like isoform X2 [Citrus sinensis]
MAEAAVNFAIETLGPLLVEEIRLWGGVRKEVQSINSELESLRSVLKDADARAAVEELEGGGEESVRTWVKQLRDEAYRIEDVIDEYTLMVAKLPHGSGLVGVLHRISRFIKKLKLRRGVATEIQDIKSALADIKRRGESYRFRSIDEPSSSGTRNVIPHDSRVRSFFVEDDEVVGIESIKDKLIDLMVNGRSERSVVAVVGEGGLGKTTLAGKTFNNEGLKTHFSCRAWVTVGKEYNKNDLLRTMLKEFHSFSGQPAPVEIHDMEEMELITTLRDHLKDKSYMVVFDDVWKIDFWGDVEHALLDNKKSSRIIVTTRHMNVAKFCKSSSLVHVHELETLHPNEAWKLFCRKAFGPSSRGCCPSELKELSQDILAKCGGLPLAIAAIGGLLSTKNRVVSEWKKLFDRLGSMLGSEPHLKDCNRVLSEGYHDLPHHLKSCLLYFGLFQESCKINCARLIRLWIAEGFVQYSKRPTSEQVAEEYLNELVDRSLVQVSERDISGRASICQVHDLMHEIVIRKTEELGFGRVLNGVDLSHCSKTRRITIQRSIDDGALESIKHSKVRTVFLFNIDKLPNSFMKTSIANFKLMKVLDLEDSPIDYLPEGVGNLFNLHYLSVKNTEVKIIPKSIGNLLSLEILDLKNTLVSELPVEIRNLKKLRYLMVYQYNYTSVSSIAGAAVAKVHRGLGSLTDLQKLSIIEADSQALDELMKLRQLRKLGIRPQNGNGKDVCALIANLENLESLTVLMASKEEILDLQSLSSPPQYLQRLYLTGNMKKLPDWIIKLKNVIRVGLDLSGLTEDPIRVLHALPNLLELRLGGTYNYELFHFEAGWFPKLQKLLLGVFEAVKSVIIEKGAMPDIRELKIGPCPLLMEIPIGIEHLKNLKLLNFSRMVKQVYYMAKDENWGKVTEHIPDVLVTFVKAEKWFYYRKEVLSSLSPEYVEQIC